MSARGIFSLRIGLPLIVLLLVAAAMAYRVREATTERGAVPTVEQIRQERGIPVAVEAITEGPLELWREFSGTVSGEREAVVRARSGDQISEISVSVGDAVEAGDALIRLAGEGAQARLRQAEAAYRQAQRTMERLRPLHEAGALSDQDWEEVLTQFELASSDLAAARDPLVLTSPLSGVVTEVLVRPGMIPDVGDPLLRVADLSGRVVYVRATGVQAADLQAGQAARLTSGDAQGRVRRIALQADPETRLVEVAVEFPPTPRLILGTLVTIEIRTAAVHAVQAPRSAVAGGRVWIVGGDGRVESREVTVGITTRDRAELLSGVRPGERIVVEGASLLVDGALVRIAGGESEGSR